MKKLAIILTLFITQANAQQLSLQDAVNIALKNSFDIQIAKNNVQISSINNNIGVAGGLPSVTATASDQESVININQKLNTGTEISRNGAASNNLNANVTGTMLLFNGYRVVATKKRLEELQKQSEQLLNAQIQNTIAAVMVKYYDVVRQQSYIKTLEQSIDLSKKQLEIVQLKQSAGLANNADLFQSQIGLNSRLQDLQSQLLIVAQTKTDLLTLLNLKADSAINIKDTILINGSIPLAEVLAGIQQNPQIISLDNQIKINELIEKETAALRAPSVRANTGVNYGRTQSDGGQLLLNQSYGPFLSVGLSIPLYSGGTVKRQQQTSSINTRNAKLQKESALNSFQSNAVKTYQSYTVNIEQVKTQQNTFSISAQLVNLVIQRYQLAQATILELTDALKSYEDASYRLTNLSYNAKIAEIELKRLSGKLGL